MNAVKCFRIYYFYIIQIFAVKNAEIFVCVVHT